MSLIFEMRTERINEMSETPNIKDANDLSGERPLPNVTHLNISIDIEKSWRQTLQTWIIYTFLSVILITTGINILNIWFSFGMNIMENSLLSVWRLIIGESLIILVLHMIELTETNQYLIKYMKYKVEWYRIFQGFLVMLFLVTIAIHTFCHVLNVWKYCDWSRVLQWRNMIITLGMGIPIITSLMTITESIKDKFVLKDTKAMIRSIIFTILILVSSLLLLFVLFAIFIIIDDNITMKAIMSAVTYFVGGTIMVSILTIMEKMGL